MITLKERIEIYEQAYIIISDRIDNDKGDSYNFICPIIWEIVVNKKDIWLSDYELTQQFPELFLFKPKDRYAFYWEEDGTLLECSNYRLNLLAFCIEIAKDSLNDIIESLKHKT